MRISWFPQPEPNCDGKALVSSIPKDSMLNSILLRIAPLRVVIPFESLDPEMQARVAAAIITSPLGQRP